MISARIRAGRFVAGLLVSLSVAVAACGGGAPAVSDPPAASGAPTAAGGPGGPITGKRLCEIVPLEHATQLLGEEPPRGEASDDRLARSHTCAYKPSPRAILRVQVVEGMDSEAQFEGLLANFAVKEPVEGIGDKAYFIARTEIPSGTRLYAWAKGYAVLVDIGIEGAPEDSLRESARGLAPTVIDAV